MGAPAIRSAAGLTYRTRAVPGSTSTSAVGTASRTGSSWLSEPTSTVIPPVYGLSETLRLVLAQEALEEPAVALLVAEDRDHHVVGHGIDLVRELDDAVVVLDRAGLGLDHAL